jgi:tyrosinase
VDVRRNIYRLGTGVAAFTAAVNALKANGTYDTFIHRHHDAMMNPSLLPGETTTTTGRNSAHRGPAFGPWHRYYIRDLELQLQSVAPGMTLPYWDWATDAALPVPQTAPLWTDPYLGGDGAGANNFVPNGPFKNWIALLMQPDMTLAPRPTAGIKRLLGRDPFGYPTLPVALEVANSLTEPLYDIAPWNEQSVSFRNRLEGFLRRPGEPPEPRMHNRVHTWVGGDMQPGTSPNDPVFFLHHANVDRLWARWQAAHATVPYAPASGGPPGHNLNQPMRDLGAAGITPASALQHHAMGYMYDDESPETTADACGATSAITVARGAMAQLMACYVNTGTVTWQRGTATQVNLVAAPLGSPSPFASWASNWLSPTAYATASQNTCAPGAMANFSFNITPPLATLPGSYLLEGELVLAATGLPVQATTYRQLVNVP